MGEGCRQEGIVGLEGIAEDILVATEVSVYGLTNRF